MPDEGTISTTLMGYFDFLIDKGKPPTAAEYIYMFNLVWVPGVLGSFPIKEGIIVTDVLQSESGRYEFTILGRPGRFECNYAWAFAENTKMNRLRILVYRALRRCSGWWDSRRSAALSAIQTLSQDVG